MFHSKALSGPHSILCKLVPESGERDWGGGGHLDCILVSDPVAVWFQQVRTGCCLSTCSGARPLCEHNVRVVSVRQVNEIVGKLVIIASYTDEAGFSGAV